MDVFVALVLLGGFGMLVCKVLELEIHRTSTIIENRRRKDTDTQPS